MYSCTLKMEPALSYKTSTKPPNDRRCKNPKLDQR